MGPSSARGWPLYFGSQTTTGIQSALIFIGDHWSCYAVDGDAGGQAADDGLVEAGGKAKVEAGGDDRGPVARG